MESMKFGANYCRVWSKSRTFLFDLGTCLLYHKLLKVLIVYKAEATHWRAADSGNADSTCWAGRWILLNGKCWWLMESWGEGRACLGSSSFAASGNFRSKFSCLGIFQAVSCAPINSIFLPRGALCTSSGALFCPLLPSTLVAGAKQGLAPHISLILFQTLLSSSENNIFVATCTPSGLHSVWGAEFTAGYPPAFSFMSHFSSLPPSFSVVAWFVASMHVTKNFTSVIVPLCWANAAVHFASPAFEPSARATTGSPSECLYRSEGTWRDGFQQQSSHWLVLVPCCHAPSICQHPGAVIDDSALGKFSEFSLLIYLADIKN